MVKNPNSRSEETTERRTFLKVITALASLVAATFVAIPGVGYLAGATRARKPQWQNLGPISKFPPQTTQLATFDNPLAQPWDGITARTGVFVKYLGRDQGFVDEFQVFAINCTHLGCPVEWFPQSGLFMCPCHGGVYYEDGERASGPPPRGLFHCPWEVRDGELWVQSPHLPTLHDTLEDRARTA